MQLLTVYSRAMCGRWLHAPVAQDYGHDKLRPVWCCFVVMSCRKIHLLLWYCFRQHAHKTMFCHATAHSKTYHNTCRAKGQCCQQGLATWLVLKEGRFDRGAPYQSTSATCCPWDPSRGVNRQHPKEYQRGKKTMSLDDMHAWHTCR